jgi:hypothetical protein
MRNFLFVVVLCGVMVSLGAWSEGEATAEEDVQVLPGFAVELLYTVPRESEGSWVSMANAPDGGLYVSDQDEAGLFHVVPAALGDSDGETVVTAMSAELSGAHGLFWAFGGLYAHVSEGRAKGLYKVTDANGDGDLDTVDYLTEIRGAGSTGLMRSSIRRMSRICISRGEPHVSSGDFRESCADELAGRFVVATSVGRWGACGGICCAGRLDYEGVAGWAALGGGE